MSSVYAPTSYTAPQMSETQQLQEISSLSAEEVRWIKFEKMGWNPIPRETPTAIEEGLRALDVVLEAFPTFDKEAFQTARQCDPVAARKSQLKFLRREYYDATAAAPLLLGYWKLRERVFGERAFRSLLDESGEGVLTLAELDQIRRCKIRLLADDNAVRKVLYFRRRECDDQQIVVKSMMYFYEVASKEDIAQRHGIVIIIDRSIDDKLEFKPNRKVAKALVEGCWPLRMCGLHFCFSSRKCLARLFHPHALQMMGSRPRLFTERHFGGIVELNMSLLRFGLPPLPHDEEK